MIVIAKTASLDDTKRLVSRCTDGGSAPALPPGARAIANHLPQPLTPEFANVGTLWARASVRLGPVEAPTGCDHPPAAPGHGACQSGEWDDASA